MMILINFVFLLMIFVIFSFFMEIYKNINLCRIFNMIELVICGFNLSVDVVIIIVGKIFFFKDGFFWWKFFERLSYFEIGVRS